MNADGTEVTRLTNEPGWDDDPAWSPDGSQIAFASDRGPIGMLTLPDIYVMKSDGLDRTNLTNNAAVVDVGPVWSPDGSQVAFVSTRDGLGDI
jgi:Tol biopolymer transport system component